MRRKVFIHTNARQMLGAMVSRHTLKRNSRNPERFDVEIIQAEDFPFLARHEGDSYLREGRPAVWRNDDLQSFTPLRFCVPELMGYEGRAVVIDPDVFAIGDINELLDRDMGGAAICARQMAPDGRRPGHYASSVMLLDCAKLRGWNGEKDFAELFRFAADYRDWMWLLREPPGTVAALEDCWNDFDRLTSTTRLLHNTHRRTQPWKSGLPADFTSRGTTWSKRVGAALRGLASRITGAPSKGFYRRHPDPHQEEFFFRMLAECLADGAITRPRIESEMRLLHLRPDAIDLLRAAGGAV